MNEDNVRPINPFESIPANDEQIVRMTEVRKAFGELADKISMLIPGGRPMSIVMTNLEQACMWAIKGISRDHQGVNPETSEVKPEVEKS